MYLTKMAERHSRWQIAQVDYTLDQLLEQESSPETLSWVMCPEPSEDHSGLPEWAELKERDANIVYAREVVSREKSRGNQPPPHWVKLASNKTQREKSLVLRIQGFFSKKKR